MKHRILMSVLLVFVVFACATTPEAPVQNVTGPMPRLLTDSLGVVESLVVRDVEVERAKSVLGDGGFIGLSTCTMQADFHKTVVDAAQKRAQELGLRLEIIDSDLDAQKQVATIEGFTARNAAAIIVCVLNADIALPALEEAARSGIFIVQYAGRGQSPNGITVSIEDSDLGCAAGEIAADFILIEKDGQASVALLDYPDLPDLVVRADQIQACLLRKVPGVKVVGRFVGGTPELGRESMQTALQAYPEIDVVISINDAGAYGAIEALEEADKDSASTIVVGIDAEAQAREWIRAGRYFRGTVDTSPEVSGRVVIDAVVKLLSSATVHKNIRVPVVKVTRDSFR